MGHPLQVWLAVLVLMEWCTIEEAEIIRARLTMQEIPWTVTEVVGQLEATLAAVRGENGGR